MWASAVASDILWRPLAERGVSYSFYLAIYSIIYPPSDQWFIGVMQAATEGVVQKCISKITTLGVAILISNQLM